MVRGIGASEASRVTSFRECREMSDGAREKDDADSRSAEDAALSARLKRLGDRLGQTGVSRPSEAGQTHSRGDSSTLVKGFRLASEFVAGILVGAALGWGLDRLLGTSPWGLIVFLLLGFAASVLNVVRSAGVVSGGYPYGGPKRRDE
jgi:ATP synthase protein I